MTSCADQPPIPPVDPRLTDLIYDTIVDTARGRWPGAGAMVLVGPHRLAQEIAERVWEWFSECDEVQRP